MSASELTVERLLRAHAPHAPEALRERVLAFESAPQRRNSPSRRLVLVALPAALAIAVLAAVVHGVVGSGSPRAVPATKSFSSGAQGTAVGSGATVHSSVRAGADSKQPLTAPSVGAPARLQHTDASLQVRVGDVDALAAATSRATRIATSLGGYAQSVDYRTPNGGGGASYLELRVPAQNVKTAIAQLGALGTLVSQELSVTDLQQTFRTQSEQIAQLRRRVAALRAALADSSLPEGQKVLLQIRLAESKRALAQRLNARGGTISAGTTAQISLVIGTEKAIAPVARHQGRLGRMMHSAVGFLALEGIILLYALIVISPLALVAAAVWAWRRRSVERLLAA
jgi:Domain of unknown function (DUF4349)